MAAEPIRSAGLGGVLEVYDVVVTQVLINRFCADRI
jgi:hypothetical protein